MRAKTTLIASDKSWIEGDAIRQLEKTAELEGILLKDLKKSTISFNIGREPFSGSVKAPFGPTINARVGLWE